MAWLELFRKQVLAPDPWPSFRAGCESYDGHEREAALRSLAALPAELHGAALPLVLARLNDWVPQVRAAAAQALRSLLRDELEAAWMDALPRVAQLMDGQRWAQDGARSRAAIEHFLLHSPQRRAALVACSPRLAPSVQRWLARQRWHHGELDERVAALALALCGLDAKLAWEALRQLQALGADWQNLAGVRPALAAAHFAGLQLVGLRQDQARGQLPSGSEAVELAFSRHGGTRGWLLFHADAKLKQQILERAEAVLDGAGPTGPRLVALQLLRELSAASLPDRLEAVLRQGNARLREMAHGLGQAVLDEAPRVALAARGLADPSPRVQAVALRAIRRGRTTLMAAELRELARREPPALPAVLRAFAGFEPWTRATATLELLAEQPTAPANAAEELRSLRQALQRSLYAPTADQSGAVERAATLLRQRHPALAFSPP